VPGGPVAGNAGPQARPAGAQPFARPGAPGAGARGRGPGGIIAGAPDLLRMFDSANGGQIAWFLPLALGRALAGLWRWRKDGPRRAAIVLALGWVLLFAGIFSFAKGIYHSYYTAALAPGIAVLSGAGIVALADLARANRRWLFAAVLVSAGTAIVQL